MNEKELLWKMYSTLFNTITDVLPVVGNTKVAEKLKQAQLDTEEMSISQGGADIIEYIRPEEYQNRCMRNLYK